MAAACPACRCEARAAVAGASQPPGAWAAGRWVLVARRLQGQAGDRWGVVSTLWRTARRAFARERLDDAEAVSQEACAVLGATGRERWIANTVGGLGDVGLLGGDMQRVWARLGDARDRSAARVANVEDQLHGLAKGRAKPTQCGAG
jgi:hypothetical protein